MIRRALGSLVQKSESPELEMTSVAEKRSPQSDSQTTRSQTINKSFQDLVLQIHIPLL
jgi:hypothetical protein